MIDELATVLSSLFGAQVRKEEGGLRTLVRSGDAFFATRVRVSPVAELFIATRPIDGFELALRWNDRWSDPDSEPAFDDAFAITTNDDALHRAWLDEVAREALLASTYIYERDDYAASFRMTDAPYNFVTDAVGTTSRFKRTWAYELANDELVVTKGTIEAEPKRIAAAISAGCALAGRSARWAREYAELARTVGGRARSEIELGGQPIITASRSAIDVSLSLLRRLPGESRGRLRTLVTAKRVGYHDERTFSLVDETAVRTMVPPLPKGSLRTHHGRDVDLASYRLRSSDDAFVLDELAKKLVAAARPSVVVADLDSIDVWYDGAPMEHARLDAAFALAAHLAVGNATAQGPYR